MKLSVVEGGLSPLITGLIYCSVIKACHEVSVERKGEAARPSLPPFYFTTA